MRTKLLERLIAKAKTTDSPMIGIDIYKHNTTKEERRYLADRGLSFCQGRGKRLILSYPQTLRAEDLRRKVLDRLNQKKGE